MKEVCSCGAKFEIQRDGTTTWTEEGFKRILEVMKDWRENHRHDMPAPEPEVEEPPFIHESAGAAVERSWAPESEARPTVLLGFQRNSV